MIQKEVFSPAGKKLNWDDDINLMPLGDSRNRTDMVYPDGNNTVLENRRALVMRYKALPAGINKCIGVCSDTENNAEIYVIYNSNSQHCIVRFKADNTFEDISYAKSQWNFQSAYPITKMKVIGTGNDAMLFMNDNYNPPRLVNLYHLENGDYPDLTDAEINLLKPAPIRKPAVTAYQLPNITKNNLTGKLFQFKYGYVYDTGQRSKPSHCSDVIYDYNNETISGDFDTGMVFGVSGTKNVIFIDLYRDYENITKLELYVKICDIGSGVSGSWKLYDTIDVDDATYRYYFYNDRQATEPVTSLNYNDDDVPIKSAVAEIIDNRIVLGQNNTGRDNVDIDIDLALVRSSLNANPTSIDYNSANPYQNITDIDISYGGGQLMSINVVIAKVINGTSTPEVEKYENYFYTYNKYVIVNDEIIDFFVANINANTTFTDIEALRVETGGTPRLLRLTNSNADPLDTMYYMYTFVSPIFSKTVSFKENSTQNLAICYYDSFNKSGRALIKNMTVKIPPYSTGNYSGYYTNYVKYTLNHLPPSWAVCYQFLRADSDVINHFSIPILIQGYYGDTSDITEDGMMTRVDLEAAKDRFYEVNEFATLNSFDVVKGDRVRVIGYITDVQSVRIAENIDVPVLGVDDDGKILLPTFGSFAEHVYWDNGTRPIYIFEFYRPSPTIESTDKIYYEIGDLLSITGGYHMTSTVTGSGVSAVNQSSGVDGVGVINFGDTYRFYYHFGCRFNNNTSEAVLKPMFLNVESSVASFNYNSRAISTGRFNYVDEDYKNETKPTLIYGGFYQSGDLNYNDLNNFTNDPVYLDIAKGAITGLVHKGDTLEVYQERGICSKYINKTVQTYADGSSDTVYSTNFLNDGSVSPFEMGCSHTMSIANNVYATYFYDLLTSSWYRRSQDGLKNITFDDTTPDRGGKMKAYGIYLSKLISTAISNGDTYYVRGVFDPVKDMYLFTYINSATTDDITIGYHEPTNSWLSWYTLYEEMYFSFNGNRFFSFNNGLLYEHHVSETRLATGVYQFHFNKFPADVKIFRFIEVDADQKWCPSSEWDITINDDATAYQHHESLEWFYSKMASLLKEIHFNYYENKWVAWFLRNVLNKKGVSNGKIGLVNGELLRGKTLNVTLRNTKTTKNILRSITIGFENSK